ncbi:MAG TPA: MBL fold metallo-hydrolase [Solirubrobacteraceae bacterium]|jgi:ribonuclease BN (tRNA processing enzyme)
MTGRLVVLGGCGAWPEAGRACSGFFVEYDGFRVVLDLGYGTLPRLLALLESVTAAGVDAVVVTHEHPDHMVDLHGLFRARWFGARGSPPVPLYAPQAVLEHVGILEGLPSDAPPLRAVFEWHPIPASAYAMGPFALESWLLPHYVPNAGVRLSADELTLAYTGDTGPCAELTELGRNADLYIIDATDRAQRSPTAADPPEPPMLLTGRQAGEAAATAGARRVLLTHFWPANDRERTRADAADAFTGEILLADEGLVVPLHEPLGPRHRLRRPTKRNL